MSARSCSLVDPSDLLKLYQENFPNPSDEILNHAEASDLEYNLEDLPKVIDSIVRFTPRM
jgi:hypothetical protein